VVVVIAEKILGTVIVRGAGGGALIAVTPVGSTADGVMRLAEATGHTDRGRGGGAICAVGRPTGIAELGGIRDARPGGAGTRLAKEALLTRLRTVTGATVDRLLAVVRDRATFA
jgi:hypothetical protein